RQSNRYGAVLCHFLASDEPVPDLPLGEVYLLPFFMSDGYFVKQKIPDIFGLQNGEAISEDRQIYQCEAIGADPSLSQIFKNMADEICSTNSYKEEDVAVLIVAHGSTKSSASREAAVLQARQLTEQGSFLSVGTAFLEEEPSVAGWLKINELPDAPVIVLGMFAAEGPHAMSDVPEAIALARTNDGSVSKTQADHLLYAGVVGTRPEMIRLIQESVGKRALLSSPV
ncbi:MAG: CbiX/SirB N-terminal domain-containing protein, partial [Sneathiella sp.]